MNEVESLGQNGRIVLVTLLSVIITIGVFVLLYVVLAGNHGSLDLFFVLAAYVTVALVLGTIISLPILVRMRGAKLWHSSLLAIIATVVSLLLLLSGFTSFISQLFSFKTNLIGVYEPVAAAIVIQFVIITLLCLIYRRSHALPVA